MRTNLSTDTDFIIAHLLGIVGLDQYELSPSGRNLFLITGFPVSSIFSTYFAYAGRKKVLRNRIFVCFFVRVSLIFIGFLKFLIGYLRKYAAYL